MKIVEKANETGHNWKQFWLWLEVPWHDDTSADHPVVSYLLPHGRHKTPFDGIAE